MNHEIDLNKYEIRTDLVLDTIENNNIDIEPEINDYDGIKVTKVVIDGNNKSLFNKKEGTYITIEFDDVTDTDNRNRVMEVFSSELKSLLNSMNIKEDDSSMVVGLGNISSTPDSLGPKVINNILVTRHLFVLGEEVKDGIREVSGIAPGVMANTGIETTDSILSIAKKIDPSFVLVVDALSASSIDRINRSIQITDTGIHPGSGVGNARKEISMETLGIPVVAIGVPTVTQSSTIVYDSINYLFKHLSYIKKNEHKNKLVFGRKNYLNKIRDMDLSLEERKEVIGLLGELSDADMQRLINEVLNSVDYNLIVTPKEVDFIIDRLVYVIAKGIDISLHREVY